MVNFRGKVYRAVKKIPRGKVASYKQIAKLVDSKNAARAVGNALNYNPNPFLLNKNGRINTDKNLIPCHRIVRSDGRVGGYAWGTKNKIAILRKEGIKIINGKIGKKYFF